MECYCSLRNVTGLLSDGKTPCERRFGEPFKGSISPSGEMVEVHPISTRDQSRLDQFDKTVFANNFLGYAFFSGRNLERRHCDCGYQGIGKDGRIRILHSENQCERSIDITKKRDEFIFPIAHGTAKLSGRFYEIREPTLRREQTVRREGFRGELQGELGERQATESKDDAEACADLLSIQGDFIHRHHNEPRVQLCRRKKH